MTDFLSPRDENRRHRDENDTESGIVNHVGKARSVLSISFHYPEIDAPVHRAARGRFIRGDRTILAETEAFESISGYPAMRQVTQHGFDAAIRQALIHVFTAAAVGMPRKSNRLTVK